MQAEIIKSMGTGFEDISLPKEITHTLACVSRPQTKKRHFSTEHKRKISEALKRLKIPKEGKNNPNWKGGDIKRICKTCNKVFYVEHSIAKRGDGKFCTKECWGKWRSKYRSGHNSPYWKGGKQKIKCVTCGKILYRKPSTLKRRKKIFCNHICHSKWLSINERGKNSPFWKGGKSFEPYGLEFNNQLREQIRKRDNYTCQKCLINQKNLRYKLHCHHIDYQKTNNSLENLIALCRSCHIQTNSNRNYWKNYYHRRKK